MKLAKTVESIYGDIKIWCPEANIHHSYLIEFTPYQYNFVGERDDTLPRNSYSIHVTWIRDNKKDRNHWVESYFHHFQRVVDNLDGIIKQLERECA